MGILYFLNSNLYLFILVCFEFKPKINASDTIKFILGIYRNNYYIIQPLYTPLYI